MVELDSTFPARYSVNVLAEGRQSDLPGYCYPGAIPDAYVEGVALEVSPATEGKKPWSATFAAGDISPNGISMCWTHPNPLKLCVVSKGEGYIVNVDQPDEWEEISLRPILGGFAVRDRGILVFYDFTCLIAVGSAGIFWRTESVSWDGLQDVSIREGAVHGKGWDSAGDRFVPFTVELDTGVVSGGSRPPR